MESSNTGLFNSVNTSVKINELMKALFKFQGLIEGIEKNAENPFHKSKYATLDQIQRAIRPALAECGLLVTQPPVGDCMVTTIIFHPDSEQYMESTLNLPLDKPTSQGGGSAITYNKRYSLVAILGLSINDDDDGNRASKVIPKSGEKRTQASTTITGKNQPPKKKIGDPVKAVSAKILEVQMKKYREGDNLVFRTATENGFKYTKAQQTKIKNFVEEFNNQKES